MLAEYKTKTNIGVGLGIALQLLGRMAIGDNPLGLVVTLIGGAVLIWGCCMYAKAKGHHPAWGLLGLFSIFGLIILVVMSDKYGEGKVPPSDSGTTTAPPAAP